LITPRFFGAAIRRKEDPRFIAGAGSFVDDMKLPKMLFAAFVRSPFAHARIREIDIDEAVKNPKVAAILTGEDLIRICKPLPITQSIPGLRTPVHHALAVGKVRHAGEPVVAIASLDKYALEDIIESIVVDYEPLDAVADVSVASSPNAPVIHDELGDNIALEWSYRGGDVDAGFQNSSYIFQEHFKIARQMGLPIEPRAVLASYSDFRGELHVWSTTQFPHQLRTELSQMLGFNERDVTVVAPDVGGGFGAKIDVYSEEAVVSLLSLRTRRPVKWAATRSEEFQSMVHAREQTHELKAGFTREGVVQAVSTKIITDVGAYLQFFGVAPTIVTAMNVPGAYRVRNYSVDVRAYFTNKVPYGSYRGFGQPQACLVMERAMEEAARELGLDPAEIRMKNLIPKEAFPYPSVTNMTYDSGNYHEALQIGLNSIGYVNLRRQQEALRKQNRYMGIGIACYSEHTGYAPSSYVGRIGMKHGGFESADVRVDPSGGVTIYTGASTHGQGLETTLAQVCADELGVDIEKVKVIHSDTSKTPYGVGALASRGAVTAGASVLLASRKVKEKAVKLAAHILEARVDDMMIEGGKAYVKGSPERAVTFESIAREAYLAHNLPEGLEPGLEASHYFDPKGLVFSFSVHLAVVELDAETGKVSLEKYLVVHDCGKVINPLIVDGQVHGGAAQGIAGALLEELIYNAEGQLLTSTLMDYTIPTSLDIPDMIVSHMETPSPITPGGMKGMGEGGTIAAFAATANAVADAIRPLQGKVTKLPLTPEAVWRLISRRRDLI
jgi:carbon-monoxide dehydrogenase large subunit